MASKKPPYPVESGDDVVSAACGSLRRPREIAADLGVSEQVLRNWVAAVRVENGEYDDLTSDERAELNQLRRKVRALEEEQGVVKEGEAQHAERTGSTR